MCFQMRGGKGCRFRSTLRAQVQPNQFRVQQAFVDKARAYVFLRSSKLLSLRGLASWKQEASGIHLSELAPKPVLLHFQPPDTISRLTPQCDKQALLWRCWLERSCPEPLPVGMGFHGEWTVSLGFHFKWFFPSPGSRAEVGAFGLENKAHST